MPTTFAVADVAVSDERLDLVSIPEAIHVLTSDERQVTVDLPDGGMTCKMERAPLIPCEAWSKSEGGVCSIGIHPFVAATQLAFDRHLPLVLSPDHLWLVLAQGFAQHVRMHAEELRPRLVSHQGRARIDVRRDDFVKGSETNPWPEVFDEFANKLREHIGKRHDLIVADFSTTGPLERAVSQLVLMDAMEKYFEYAFHSMCGIPSITLLGTPEDWRSVRTRAQVFREFELDFWIDPLLPILDAFVDASEGRVDTGFWNSMYKLKNASGGPYVTGWMQALFPYLVDKSSESGLRLNTNLAAWAEGMESPFGGGPLTSDFPCSLSSVPFVWHYLIEKFDMEFLGGFVGVGQDTASPSISPHIAWAVREA
jgi:hypothetical protein